MRILSKNKIKKLSLKNKSRNNKKDLVYLLFYKDCLFSINWKKKIKKITMNSFLKTLMCWNRCLKNKIWYNLIHNLHNKNQPKKQRNKTNYLILLLLELALKQIICQYKHLTLHKTKKGRHKCKTISNSKEEAAFKPLY